MEESQNKAYVAFRATVDIAMGVLYCTISLYAMQQIFLLEKYGKNTVFTIGILFSLYGIFRLVRGGIKFKNTFLKKKESTRFNS
jgi:Gpi18-like mannosyltransferase